LEETADKLYRQRQELEDAAGLGKTEPEAHILDLAPTFLSCLAVQPPEIMVGRSLLASSADEQ